MERSDPSLCIHHFRVSIKEFTDTVVWHRKHFVLPREAIGKKVLIEFEEARKAAEVWVNGKYVGLCENGVMAFAEGKLVITVEMKLYVIPCRRHESLPPSN